MSLARAPHNRDTIVGKVGLVFDVVSDPTPHRTRHVAYRVDLSYGSGKSVTLITLDKTTP